MNVFADDRGSKCKLTLPVFVAQHDYGIGAFLRVIRVEEQAAGRGFETEHGEIVSADHAAGNLFVRRCTLSGIDFDVMVAGGCAQSVENRVPVAKFLVQWIREDVGAGCSIGTLL